MILTVSYAGENHTERVHEALKAVGREPVLLDLAAFPATATLDMTFSNDIEESFISLSSRKIIMEEVLVGWWRRVRQFSVQTTGIHQEHASFIQSETSQAIHGLLDKLPCQWINPRKDDEIAHRKPYQWAIARQVGLKIPKTLVTNDPDRARQFIQEIGLGKVVYKAFLASTQAWRETRLVRAEDMDLLSHVRSAPVIFQEYVPGVDLRITVVGDKIFPVAIDASKSSYPVDMRMVIGESRVERAKLPNALEKKLLKLQKKLNLYYGAIDMRKTPDGDYVFFEVNPAGQWLFVEDQVGFPITQAMASLLIEKEDEQKQRNENHRWKNKTAIQLSFSHC